jgi:hypothetical protein
MGLSASYLHSILFGDQEPNLKAVTAAAALGVPLVAWSEPPKQRFVPPAARKRPSNPPHRAA